MKYFKCQCGWGYVTTRKKVFGPIFEDNDASAARIMTRLNWEFEYSDCAFQLKHPRKAAT